MKKNTTPHLFLHVLRAVHGLKNRFSTSTTTSQAVARMQCNTGTNPKTIPVYGYFKVYEND